MRTGHVLAVALLAASVLAACDKGPPAPEKAAAPAAPVATAPPPSPAPPVEDRVQRAASEAYIYGYPLVLTDVAREMRTADAPVNALRPVRIGDPTASKPVDPNEDFLYTQGWLDLSRGPVLLSVPDTAGRYYLITLIDAWSNVASSLGKRTTGTEKATFAIVGPQWKGELPGGVYEVRSPTNLAWLLGRMEVRGPADRAAAQKLLDRIDLKAEARARTPAKGSGGTRASPPAREMVAAKGSRGPNPAEPADPQGRVAAMEAGAFFTRLAALLPGNPPSADDAPMVATLKLLGIDAGKPFDPAKLDPAALKSIDAGVAAARKAMATASAIATVDFRNGWSVDRSLGRFGNDYGKRAVTAEHGLGANAPEDAVFFIARLDGGGRKLDGAQRYVLHFDRASMPPVDGFWSLSLYDEQGRFPGNADRYHLGSSEVTANPDGSVDVHLQGNDPGSGRTSNWLPTPSGPFHVVLRLYAPKQPALDGNWNAPGIRPAS